MKYQTTLSRTENDINREIEAALSALGLGGYSRNNTGVAHGYVKYGKVGSGDWIGFMTNGLHFEIEAKRPGKNPTLEQIKHGKRLLSCGGKYIVANSGEDVIEKMQWSSTVLMECLKAHAAPILKTHGKEWREI